MYHYKELSVERRKQYERVKAKIGNGVLTTDVVEEVLGQCRSKSGYQSYAALLRRIWYEQYGYTKESFATIEWYFANRGDAPNAKTKVPHYVSDEDIEHIVANSGSERQKLMIRFLSQTGFRISEMVDLRIKDLRYEKNAVVCKYYAKKTKDVCYRSVDKRLIERVFKVFGGGHYLFETSKNTKYRYRYITNQIAKIGMRAIGKRISAHTFRHYWITKQHEQGIPLEEISRMVGHRNPETTYRYYIHREVAI